MKAEGPEFDQVTALSETPTNWFAVAGGLISLLGWSSASLMLGRSPGNAVYEFGYSAVAPALLIGGLLGIEGMRRAGRGYGQGWMTVIAVASLIFLVLLFPVSALAAALL